MVNTSETSQYMKFRNLMDILLISTGQKITLILLNLKRAFIIIKYQVHLYNCNTIETRSNTKRIKLNSDNNYNIFLINKWIPSQEYI